MNPILITLALAVLLPVTLGAAGGPPPAERPFDSVRQDLGAIKSANPAVPGARLDLGAAAGISGSGSFAAPPSLSTPARPPESAATTRPEKSSGWLLDALEANSRKTEAGVARSDRLDDPASAVDKEPNGRSAEAAKDATKHPTSTLPTAVNSPLSAHMATWLSPDEFRRLGNLHPDMTDGGMEKDPLADPSYVRRLDGATSAANGMTVQDAGQMLSGGAGSPQTPGNPFVQAMQAGPRAVSIAAPAAAPRVIPVPPATMTAPVSAAARPQNVVPEAPGADDRRYFPQLKRF